MQSSNSGVVPMDVDPVDGGPRAAPLKISSTPISAVFGGSLTKEEEARQAIELLRSDDVAGRVAAAHRLDVVASILGVERTRDELLPFVTDGIDDEDEVLLAMALSLGRMVELVGGPMHAHALLGPLELLLTVEENAVRDAATNSVQFIAEQMNEESFTTHYADMVARLAMKEWFTARMSAAGLIAAAFPRLKNADQQDEHLNYFARLCKDDTPMVRRVAAKYLGVMVRNVVQVMGRDSLDEDGRVNTILMPLYEEFASNEQPDSVRLQTTENCAAFGVVMSSLAKEGPLRDPELDILRRILPLIVSTIDDRSWRVRWTAAAKFADVIRAYDPLPESIDSLVPAYEKLLQDPEAEVRAAATFNLAHVARSKALVSAPQHSRPHPEGGSASGPRITVAERLVKRVTSLTEDDSEHVRAALAMVATELAPILGKDATITYLVPPILLLLRDAASEVRLNLISSLAALNEVIGVDLLSQSLLPAILDLAQDGKWRIRLAIISHIPLLAKQLGKEFFTEKLVTLCVGWLGDDIATIRKAAASNLKELTSLFGSEWSMSCLIPYILEIKKHPSYLRRLTGLDAICMMATAMEVDVFRLEVLPLILEMATDPVANIRFNVAKYLESLSTLCGLATYEAQILPVLSMLLDDTDRDVRYYAEKTAAVLEDAFSKS